MKRYINNISIQTIGGLVTWAIMIIQALILLPVIIEKIGLGNYSIWVTATTVYSLAPMLNFGIAQIYVPMLARSEGRDSQLIRFASHIYIVAIALILMLSGFILAIYDVQDKVLLTVGVIAVCAGQRNEFIRSTAQSSFKAIYATYSEIISKLINFFILMIFINLELVLEGLFISFLVAELSSYIFLSKYVKIPRPTSQKVLGVISITEIISSTFLNAFNRLQQQFDMLFIVFFNDPVTTALVALHFRIIDFARRFIIILNNALLPSLSHSIQVNQYGILKYFKSLYAVLVTFISALVYFCSEYLITYWTGNSSLADVYLITLLSFYFLTLSIRRFISTRMLASSGIHESLRLNILDICVRFLTVSALFFWSVDMRYAIIYASLLGNITFISVKYLKRLTE